MFIKPQDVVVLAKLLSRAGRQDWTQNGLAMELCLSPSQVNAALKRLAFAGLINPANDSSKAQPIVAACEEFFISGLKYIFPAKLGGMSRGIATSYAGPVLNKQIVQGQEPIPVWPYGEGDKRGLALKPLYPSVPESVAKHPDPAFYELLTVLDAIRSGRARERAYAAEMIKQLRNWNQR